MDSPIVLLVVAFVGLFALAFLAFTGWLSFIVWFFYNSPLLLVALFVVAAGALAYKFGQVNIALSSLGLVLILVAGDFYLPPLSVLCTRPDSEALITLKLYPESSFADDSAICYLWTSITGFNPAVLDYKLQSPINSFLLAIPFFIILFSLFVALAILVSPRFWFGVFLVVLYVAMYLILFPSLMVSEIVITLAGIICYGIVSPILLVIGNWLVFYFQ
jgi:hypothetical protein